MKRVGGQVKPPIHHQIRNQIRKRATAFLLDQNVTPMMWDDIEILCAGTLARFRNEGETRHNFDNHEWR